MQPVVMPERKRESVKFEAVLEEYEGSVREDTRSNNLHFSNSNKILDSYKE